MKRFKSPSAFDEISVLLRLYSRQGGHKHRRAQISKIRRVMKFAQLRFGIKSVHELGHAQIMAFYRSHDFSERTLYDYDRALKILYTALGRTTPPPVPLVGEAS